jgi:hypothetical protein
MRLTRVLIVIAASGLLTEQAAIATPCQDHFDSTFDLIQSAIFERHGCTSATCHSGAAPAGGLDLSRGAAYDNLIDQLPQSVAPERFPGLARVVPGSKARSLLWLNLASATLPGQWRAPLRSMPLGGLPPLSIVELELLRMWIEYGASRDGVVPGSGEGFDACLPPPQPIKVKPLPPPPPGLGVQLRAPQQVLPPHSEREVCFVSYYDVSDQVPAEFRGPGGNTFRYQRADARQDPLSHHAVVDVYVGRAALDDPVWGPFTCAGGPMAGESCQPADPTACGSDGACASPPVQAVACIGYGPGDASIGFGEQSLFTSMGTSGVNAEEGIFAEAPLRGILVWNSHAFNITDAPATLDMWLNFEFAAPAQQLHPLRPFTDVSAIAKMKVPPYGVEEVCHHYVVPDGARLTGLASHTHKRGKRFRIFEGEFSCAGGSFAGQACSPFGRDPDLPVRDLCGGAACLSRRVPRVGDCDHDQAISIDELVTGLDIALGTADLRACPEFDGDDDGVVAIDELTAGIEVALRPLRDAQESLLYTSLTYSDPLLLSFDPPHALAPAGAAESDRTLTYCALYDNGYSNPDDVKRNSTIPSNGAPCRPTHCAEGVVGRGCMTDIQCDTSPQSGDGACDACSVGFGVTTDDEMFVLAGAYVRD